MWDRAVKVCSVNVSIRSIDATPNMASVCAFPFTATVDSFFSVCAPRGRRTVLQFWRLLDWSDSDCWNHKMTWEGQLKYSWKGIFFTVSLEGGNDYSNHSTLPSTRGRVDIVVKLTWNSRPQSCPLISLLADRNAEVSKRSDESAAVTCWTVLSIYTRALKWKSHIYVLII